MKRKRGRLVGEAAQGHSDLVVEPNEYPVPSRHVSDQHPTTLRQSFEVRSTRHKMLALAKMLKAARTNGDMIERLHRVHENHVARLHQMHESHPG